MWLTAEGTGVSPEAGDVGRGFSRADVLSLGTGGSAFEGQDSNLKIAKLCETSHFQHLSITKEGKMNMIGHTGSQGGFISDYCWLPEQKVFYVLLCNIPKPIKDMRMKLFTLLEQHKWLD